MALTEPQLEYRQNVIETLQLISSREEQLDYQRDVPIAHVTAEIFCHWTDGCYQNGKFLKEKWCISAFSATELQAIAEFNETLNQVSDSALELRSIDQFVLTPEWAKLSEAAARALRVFQPLDAASSNNQIKLPFSG